MASGDWAGEAIVWLRDSGEIRYVLREHHAFAGKFLCILLLSLVSGVSFCLLSGLSPFLVSPMFWHSVSVSYSRVSFILCLFPLVSLFVLAVSSSNCGD